jgi:hypothetical protein
MTHAIKPAHKGVGCADEFDDNNFIAAAFYG